MRITLIGPAYPFRGGVSQHTTLLGHYLRRVHEVDFISFRRQYPKLLFPGKTDRDPSRVPDREPCAYLLDPMNPMSWADAANRIRGFNPRIVVMVWWVPFFALVWWYLIRRIKSQTGASVVFVCHNVLPHEKNVLFDKITQFLVRLPDGFIVHSESDKQELSAIRHDARVIRCPIAPHPRIALPEGGKKESRLTLGIDLNKTVFLFFGFVRPYKGLDLLLEAMDKVVRAYPETLLLVVGEFWEPVQKTKRQAERLGLERNVRIIDGYIPNEKVGIYFSACDAVVLPYRSATQSGVPQVARSMGRPMIVTDVGGLAENVLNPGMGKVVPPGDVPALASAMTGIIRSNRKSNPLTKSETDDSFPESWKEIVNAITDLSVRKGEDE